MPDISQAKQLLGWMSEAELTWLAEQAKRRSAVVEIGSYLGRSTRAIADNAVGRLMAIDTWRNADTHVLMQMPKHMLGPNWLWQGFLYNVKDLIPERLEVRRRNSLAAAEELRAEGKRFDMIFIDAGHEYAEVKADIAAWKPLLRDGGLLCGHDFTGKHQGVIQAVRESVPQFTIAVDSIWAAA